MATSNVEGLWIIRTFNQYSPNEPFHEYKTHIATTRAGLKRSVKFAQRSAFHHHLVITHYKTSYIKTTRGI